MPDSTASSVPSSATSAEGLAPSRFTSPNLRVTCFWKKKKKKKKVS